MNTFKFFSKTNDLTKFIPILTMDTNTTYHIPIDILADILVQGMEWINGNMMTITKFYHLRDVYPEMMIYRYTLTNVHVKSNRMWIEYTVRFPNEQVYHKFRTIQRVA